VRSVRSECLSHFILFGGRLVAPRHPVTSMAGLGHNILYVTVGLVWIHLAEYNAKGKSSYHPARP
jgi:hypothetical protein